MGWFIASAFAAATGLESARQQRKAGKEASRDAKRQAAEQRRQKFDIDLLATQQHQDLMEQFQETLAYNEAATAFAGRTGRSLQAIQKREARLYARDVERLRTGAEREKAAIERGAVATEERGRSAARAAKTSATSSLLQTGYKLASLK